jgi:hypothetical protein
MHSRCADASSVASGALARLPSKHHQVCPCRLPLSFPQRPWASQLPASYAPALNPRRAAPFDPLVTDHQTGGLDGKMDRQEFSQLVRQLFSMMADQKAAEEGVPAA